MSCTGAPRMFSSANANTGRIRFQLDAEWAEGKARGGVEGRDRRTHSRKEMDTLSSMMVLRWDETTWHDAGPTGPWNGTLQKQTDHLFICFFWVVWLASCPQCHTLISHARGLEPAHAWCNKGLQLWHSNNAFPPISYQYRIREELTKRPEASIEVWRWLGGRLIVRLR